MFCDNCGNRVGEGARFCRYCGRPITEEQLQPPVQQAPPVEQAASNAGLPAGMTYEQDGSISWTYSGRGTKDRMRFQLSDKSISYVYLPSKKKGSLFKELLLDISDMAVMDSDSYAGGVLPSEVLGTPEGALSRSFEGMKWIKQDRKRDLIKINSANAYASIYAAPEQYDFVLNYIKSHSPGAKLK